MPTTTRKRPTPIRIQLATLADAARVNLITANELMTQLAHYEPATVPRSFVDAHVLTNQHLVQLLADAPTLLPEPSELAPVPIAPVL